MMRLSSLNLELFGHFKDRSFQFPKPPEGIADFHLIYGPNEAGKTTTMEGLIRLLYGFEHSENYAFKHQRKNLRVSASLEINGQESFFRRLPQRDNNLLNDMDVALPETAISQVMAGLSVGDYRNLFCLDDETIEKGGDDIVNSKGDIGMLLFSAAAGLSDLSSILEQTEEEARDLYLKSGSKSQYANLKHQLEEINKQISEFDLSAADLGRLRSALDAAKSVVAERKENYERLIFRKTEIEAVARALPKIAKHGELSGNIASFSHFPKHLEIEPKQLDEMQLRFSELETKLGLSSEEDKTLGEQLAGIDRLPKATQLDDQFETVSTLHSRYATAILDLPRLQGELAELEIKTKAQLAILSPNQTLDGNELALEEPVLAELQALREQMVANQQAVASRQAEILSLKEKSDDLAIKLERSAAELPDNSSLLELFDQIDMDELLQNYIKATSEIEKTNQKLRSALTGLTIKGQEFDAIPVASLTLVEAEALVKEISETIGKQNQLIESLSDLEIAQEKITDEIKALSDGSGLKSPEETKAARQERDTAWQELRTAFTQPAADQFETLMARVDVIADAQVLRAEDVGQIRQLQSNAIDHQAQHKQQKMTLERTQTALNELQERLAEAIKQAGIISKLAPDGFVDWLRRHELAQQAASEAKWAKADHQETLEKTIKVTTSLRAILLRPSDGFVSLVKLAKEKLKEHQEIQSKLKTDQSQFEHWEQELKSRNSKLEALKIVNTEQCAQRDALLAEHLPRLLSLQSAGDDVLTKLGTLRKLAGLKRQQDELAQRISGMQRDQSQFAEAMHGLAREQEIDQSEDPLQIWQLLKQRADTATKAETEWKRLSDKIEQNKNAKNALEVELEVLKNQMKTFAGHFDDAIPVATIAQLRDAVAKSHEVINWRQQLATLEAEVKQGLDIDDFAKAQEKVSEKTAKANIEQGATELEAQIASLEHDIKNSRQTYDDALGELAVAANQLKSIRGDDQIALLVQQRKTIELEIQEVLTNHLELAIGKQLAETAIGRYRERHRSEMLAATEVAFSELTNGAYLSLKTRPEKDKSVLWAIDSATLTAKQANDLSKGTRFQLYLALRAAAYEQMVNKGVVLPFLCDDIFETFDEERTAAACKLMQRVGNSGQAIYFTHHRHVADIAKEVCGENVQLHQF